MEEDEEWKSKLAYPDELTFRLFHAMAGLLKLSAEEALEQFGEWMLDFAMSTQWDMLLKCLADNVHDFLDNLSPMHYFIDNVAFQNEMRGPSFRCEPNSDGSLKLHYYSERKAMFPMAKGLLRRAALRLFRVELEVVVLERNREKKGNAITEHVVFGLRAKHSLIKPAPPALLALGKRPAGLVGALPTSPTPPSEAPDRPARPVPPLPLPHLLHEAADRRALRQVPIQRVRAGRQEDGQGDGHADPAEPRGPDGGRGGPGDRGCR